VAADKILLTGATGFVGSAVAHKLVAAGYKVRVLLRPTSARTNLANLDVELVEGDMRDEAAVGRAMNGMRYLFHVAADYRLWARDPDEIVRTNRDGTRIVMRSALQAGIERIVYTSSVATIRVATDRTARDCLAPDRLADETSRLEACAAIGAYKRSKVVAERLVEDMISHDRLPAVIVHPSTPVGPRDVKPTPTGRIIVEAASGRIPGFVETGLNLVHVDDVAEGHIAALRNGQIGEHYILGGQNVSLACLLGEIAALSGRKPPRICIPRPFIYPLAFAAQAMAHITRREPFVTLDGLRMSKQRMFFSSAKAERDLGYRARPYQEALVEALQWFRLHGYLR